MGVSITPFRRYSVFCTPYKFKVTPVASLLSYRVSPNLIMIFELDNLNTKAASYRVSKDIRGSDDSFHALTFVMSPARAKRILDMVEQLTGIKIPLSFFQREESRNLWSKLLKRELGMTTMWPGHKCPMFSRQNSPKPCAKKHAFCI